MKDAKEIVKKFDFAKQSESAYAIVSKDKAFQKQLSDDGFSMEDVNSNAIEFYDYSDDFAICKGCKGLGNCPKDNPGQELRISKDGGFVRFYQPCMYLRQKMTLESRFVRHDFPDEFFQMFTQLDQGKERHSVFAALKGAMVGKLGDWVYLSGSPSSGKSYLAAFAADKYAKATGKKVAFVDVPKLVEEATRKIYAKDDAGYRALMDSLLAVDVLVLDDFGNESRTKGDFSYMNVIFPLLKERMDKSNIFTSDFTPDEASELYFPSIGSIRVKQLRSLLSKAKYAECKGVGLY